jgi:hypothetical protein
LLYTPLRANNSDQFAQFDVQSLDTPLLCSFGELIWKVTFEAQRMELNLPDEFLRLSRKIRKVRSTESELQSLLGAFVTKERSDSHHEINQHDHESCLDLSYLYDEIERFSGTTNSTTIAKALAGLPGKESCGCMAYGLSRSQSGSNNDFAVSLRPCNYQRCSLRQNIVAGVFATKFQQLALPSNWKLICEVLETLVEIFANVIGNWCLAEILPILVKLDRICEILKVRFYKLSAPQLRSIADCA